MESTLFENTQHLYTKHIYSSSSPPSTRLFFFFGPQTNLKRLGSGHGRFGHCRSSTMLDLPRGRENTVESPNVGRWEKPCNKWKAQASKWTFFLGGDETEIFWKASHFGCFFFIKKARVIFGIFEEYL